ncbi:MAG: HD domain-containing protein [Clostridiales bacterium]|nr:HD domain-containing protein [Clostridiales bacterium]
MLSYETIRQNENIRTYIRKADESLRALGYTEHSFAHVTKVAETAGEILSTFGYSTHDVELVKIAGYLHDIGNNVNRCDHAQSGALMAYAILTQMGMPAGEVLDVVCAIGNHDESTGLPINPLAAAIIIGDKTDVRKNRVRTPLLRENDIHDRVNGAVDEAEFLLDRDTHTITLSLHIDTAQCSVIEYFQIFLTRMQMCRRAADSLGCPFRLMINGAVMMG